MSMRTRRTKKPSGPRQPLFPGSTRGLLIATIVLLVIGVVTVYEASALEAIENYSDRMHFARLQLQWIGVGLVGMVVTSLLSIQLLKKITVPLLLASLFFLLIVLIPGIGTEVGGARRWLSLGFFNFQPSELMKFSLILYLSAFFQKTVKYQPFFVLLVATIALIMMQPDLGTTLVIIATSMSLFFVAGASWTAIVGLVMTGVAGVVGLILTSPYRMGRLLTFLDPQRDPTGASYHIRQILIAIGSGGVFGLGIGKSLQKYRYLPEAMTDSIFAVYAEETGLIGSLVLLLIFMYVAYKGFWIASRTKDNYLQLLATGTTCLIILQAFLNLAALTALVPLTGIPLPFISYGGTSMVISLASIGLLINIARNSS